MAENGKNRDKIGEIEDVMISTFNTKSGAIFYRAILSEEEIDCADALELGCYTQYYNMMAVSMNKTSYCGEIAINDMEVENCKDQVPAKTYNFSAGEIGKPVNLP